MHHFLTGNRGTWPDSCRHVPAGSFFAGCVLQVWLSDGFSVFSVFGFSGFSFIAYCLLLAAYRFLLF